MDVSEVRALFMLELPTYTMAEDTEKSDFEFFLFVIDRINEDLDNKRRIN